LAEDVNQLLLPSRNTNPDHANSLQVWKYSDAGEFNLKGLKAKLIHRLDHPLHCGLWDLAKESERQMHDVGLNNFQACPGSLKLVLSIAYSIPDLGVI
jgi:hypothetical protein